jgi:uncharacterized protein YicC (UPF0701 family)
MADADNEKAFDSIMANIDKIEDAIKDLKKDRESLGESFDDIDGRIWAIEWLLENIERMINDHFYFLND